MTVHDFAQLLTLLAYNASGHRWLFTGGCNESGCFCFPAEFWVDHVYTS